MVGMNGINNTMNNNNNNNNTSTLNGTNGSNNTNNNNNTIMNHNHRNYKNQLTKKKTKKKFYPKLIATQIIAIQCFHYLILTLLYEMNAILFNPTTTSNSSSNIQMNSDSSSTSNKNMPLSITTTYMSLDHIFTDQYIHLYQLSSYPDIITTFIAAICTAYIFVIIIEKSKQCLDFAITLFILHIIFVSMYNYHVPNHIEWYIVHVLATIIMILLAEHLCAKRELDDIPLLTL